MCRYKHQGCEICAKTYKIESLSVKQILKDKNIDIILNLTIPSAHYSISKKAILNGKHVYSEKPLATNFNEGKKLIRLAKQKTFYWKCSRHLFGRR